MELAIEHRPDSGPAEQLLLLWHGWAQEAQALAPLADALRREFPQAVVLVPQSPLAADPPQPGRMWYSIRGLRDQPETWPARVQAALLPLADWVRRQQQHHGVGPAATCLGGFSQGALLALELAARDDGIAGRVLAFGGRFVSVPTPPPRQTTLHFFHGDADAVFDAAEVQRQFEQIGEQQGDATIDIAHGVGHELHPALIERALFRLRNHIPMRTWQAALGAAQAGGRAQGDDEDR